MTTISMRTDEPAAGVQMNQSFRPATAGAISERHEMGSGTKTAKKPCKDGPKDLITELLGDSITTTNVLSRNLDLQSGYPHTTTGIPYSIQGSAKVISVKVGEYLASFSDPIKAILSTNIHKESRVIITRKYVVGGR